MQAALFAYDIGMTGKGKKALVMTEAAAVIAGVVGAPKTFVVDATTDPVFKAGAPFNVPVQVAPDGQQATFRATSVVQKEPTVQQAPL